MLFYSINTKLNVTLGSDGVMGAMVESRCWGGTTAVDPGHMPLLLTSHPFLSAHTPFCLQPSLSGSVAFKQLGKPMLFQGQPHR